MGVQDLTLLNMGNSWSILDTLNLSQTWVLGSANIQDLPTWVSWNSQDLPPKMEFLLFLRPKVFLDTLNLSRTWVSRISSVHHKTWVSRISGEPVGGDPIFKRGLHSSYRL